MLPNVLKLPQNCYKNLKKFMVIFHINIHLHEFFQIFLSNRVLWRKSFLIVCFSPCYLNGKNEVSGASTSRSNWTLSPYGIFFIIFLEKTSNRRMKKKWIWEIRNALIYTFPCIIMKTVDKLKNSVLISSAIMILKMVYVFLAIS